MPVLARDSEAVNDLVAAQFIAVGVGELDISCGEYERVVMCPAWTVGHTFGPGRHRWLGPSPQYPAIAYFIRTAPVRVSFDMSTTFVLATGGGSIRINAQGALQVRCVDANTLIAQLIALPIDSLNAGIVRSVVRSVERMLARLLTRRVVTAGTAEAVTNPAEGPSILAELVKHNPLAGAVSGIEVVQVDQLVIIADDGAQVDTASQPGVPIEKLPPLLAKKPVTSERAMAASGEIVVEARRSATWDDSGRKTLPFGTANAASPEDRTHPDMMASARSGEGSYDAQSEHSTILGIGMAAIGTASHGETAPLASGFSPGTRVLVPSLKQTAIVRQLQRGYYELEVGGSGDTIWVPATGVVPE